MPRAKPIALWLLYVLPLAYASVILLVVFHEVVGHGFTAILCGGTFSRFEVQATASGRAWTSAPEGMRIWVLLGGIVWSCGMGLALAIVLRVTHPRPRLRMAGIVLATTLLHDSFAYGAWSAVWGENSGDTWQALQLVEAEWLKPVMSASLFVSLALTTWLSTAAVVRCLEAEFGTLGPGLSLATGVGLVGIMYGGYVASGGFAVVGVVSDWPGIAATALQAIACVVELTRRRPPAQPSPPNAGWPRALLYAWGSASVLFAASYFWMRHGVLLVDSAIRFE